MADSETGGAPSELSASTGASFVLADPVTPPRTGNEDNHSGDDEQIAVDNDDDDDDDDAELDSLPSISTSVLSGSSDGGDSHSTSDAQREWEASLEQLQLMLTLVLVPFAGKFLGRKFAYWTRTGCYVFGFLGWQTQPPTPERRQREEEREGQRTAARLLYQEKAAMQRNGGGPGRARPGSP
ncbi:hypothetical protein SPI_00380 [Niveomyces insectorum RCEF 264]|uniref:Uncharacterized protein n=1 Tax=Niveomyces insectorum RCEF 264 TaxID=1081102 RepID=A0A168A375_9HYPO|nr:hypothetical protein SPI_00380 [Niveomyces insectorum RCEF 264]